MALFGKSDVSLLQQRITELETSLDTSNARLVELEEENKDYKQTIAHFHLATEKYDKQMESMKKQYELKIDNLNKQITETENSVNKRINQQLQSMGVSNFLLEIPVEIKSSREVYQKFLSMPNGSEKTEFFKNNEAAIRKGMASQQT